VRNARSKREMLPVSSSSAAATLDAAE